MSGEVNKAVSGALVTVFLADRGDFIGFCLVVLGLLVNIYQPQLNRSGDMLLGAGLAVIRFKSRGNGQ